MSILKPLASSLTQLGYSHYEDADSERDGKVQLFDPSGKLLGRFDAFEIIGFLSNLEREKHGRR